MASLAGLFSTLRQRAGFDSSDPSPTAPEQGGAGSSGPAPAKSRSGERKKAGSSRSKRDEDQSRERVGRVDSDQMATARAGMDLNQQHSRMNTEVGLQRTSSGTLLPPGEGLNVPTLDPRMSTAAARAPAPPELSPDLLSLVQAGEMTLAQAQELQLEMMGGLLPPQDAARDRAPSDFLEELQRQTDARGYASAETFVPPPTGRGGGSREPPPPQGTIPEDRMAALGMGTTQTLAPSSFNGRARQETMPYASPAASRPGSAQSYGSGAVPGDAAHGSGSSVASLDITRPAGHAGGQRTPHSRRTAASTRPRVLGGITGGRLRLRVVRALNLRNTALGILPGDVSDPFVVARMGRQEFETQVIQNNLNPVWNSRHFEFAIEHEDAKLELEVLNSQQWHAHDSLGKMEVRIADLVPGRRETRAERLDEGDAHRDDGKRASLEVEVLFLSAEQLANGGAQLAEERQAGGPALPPGDKKKKPNLVPLPSFHSMGPEAFEAPKPVIDDAPVGQQRRQMEQYSRACRLGQYDYSRDPDYNPNQEEIDKGMWKVDPFYGWRRELERAEHRGAPMLGMSPPGDTGRLVVRARGHVSVQEMSRAALVEHTGEHSDAQDMERWHKDPFHGWLQHDKGGQPENNLEKLQEAAVARQLLRLPSFQAADRRRFPEDHREYAAPGEAAAATRARFDQREEEVRTEKKWKEDAFFGWLPGRGPDNDQKHHLSRPLHLARDQRLPSFSESPELLGVTGRPEAIGILSVWVNGALNLSYDSQSGLRGKPSACVRLRVGDGPTKVTSTVPTSSDPRWNTPAMLFEVCHPGERVVLEVLDLANPRPDKHLHQYFLGRVEKDVMEIQEAAQHQQAGTQPVRFREELHGAASQAAQLDFEASFEAYNDESAAPRQQLQYEPPPRRRAHELQGRPSRPLQSSQQPHLSTLPRRSNNGSFRTNASSELAAGGVLSVVVRCAYGLVNKDTGMYGDVSDPYVTVRLESQAEHLRKRTHTVQNNLNPVWNTQPFLLPLQNEDDTLIFEVWDENMLSEPEFLGGLELPLSRFAGNPNKPNFVRERLQGVEHGELEVEIGISPG